MKGLVQTIQQDVIEITDQLNLLYNAMLTANENGLLKDDCATYKRIVDYILEAFNNISENPPNIIEARRNFSFAFCLSLIKL